MTTLKDITTDLVNEVLMCVDELKINDLPEEVVDEVTALIEDHLQNVKDRLIG